MAVFIVAPKVMFTCQSEGAILYCDLHSRLMYPQTHTQTQARVHTHTHTYTEGFCVFTFTCACRAHTLKE